jgi:hypothetical protein
MKSHGFDITYMAWENFRDDLLGTEDFIERLTSKYNLLIGGLISDCR